MTRRQLFGISFDDGSLREAAEKALCLITEKRAAYAVTPNPEIMMKLRADPSLRAAVQAADLILPDGVGLIYASRITGNALQHRIPGIDFSSKLMDELARRQGSVYLLGAKPGVAEKAAQNLRMTYPGLRVAGVHHGYFREEESTSVLEQIQETQPDLLLVCLGAPKQELWMARYARRLPVGLMVGLGGALDVYAGRISRAPAVFRRLGLEWLFRLIRQPSRIVRMKYMPAFLYAAIKERNRCQ